jgi:hypothetical protein
LFFCEVIQSKKDIYDSKIASKTFFG